MHLKLLNFQPVLLDSFKLWWVLAVATLTRTIAHLTSSLLEVGDRLLEHLKLSEKLLKHGLTILISFNDLINYFFDLSPGVLTKIFKLEKYFVSCFRNFNCQIFRSGWFGDLICKILEVFHGLFEALSVTVDAIGETFHLLIYIFTCLYWEVFSILKDLLQFFIYFKFALMLHFH